MPDAGVLMEELSAVNRVNVSQYIIVSVCLYLRLREPFLFYDRPRPFCEFPTKVDLTHERPADAWVLFSFIDLFGKFYDSNITEGVMIIFI